MAPILDFIVNFLLVNSKIYKIMSHKIFQTQKGVNFTLPKTYPYMTLSNNTNNLAVLAVCKNIIMMAHFLTPGITVHPRSWFWQKRNQLFIYHLSFTQTHFDRKFWTPSMLHTYLEKCQVRKRFLLNYLLTWYIRISTSF